MPDPDPTRRFFHCCSAETELPSLLDPDRQWSEPWGASEHGPCDKCEDADLERRLVVELEGTLAEERDLDADAGVLLPHPSRVVEARPLDTELVESIRARA